MTTRRKILLAIGGFYIGSIVLLVAIFGFTRRDFYSAADSSHSRHIG